MTTVNQIQAQFKSPSDHASIAYHIPMEMLEEVRQAYRNEGIKIRVRFRGPRVKHQVRSRLFEAYHTLKNDAVAFSVYAK
jgi:hypothetical protein